MPVLNQSAEDCAPECHSALCHLAESHSAENCSAECYVAECHLAREAFLISTVWPTVFLLNVQAPTVGTQAKALQVNKKA
jgi:hypothetical protein